MLLIFAIWFPHVEWKQYTLCPAAWTHLPYQVLCVVTCSLYVPLITWKALKRWYQKWHLGVTIKIDISPASHLVFKHPVTCRSFSAQWGLLPSGRHLSILGPWALGLYPWGHEVIPSLTLISHWLLRLDIHPIKFSQLSGKSEGLFVGSHLLDWSFFWLAEAFPNVKVHLIFMLNLS